jgi:gliding motility-associated lipoprotein GldH
LKKHFLFLILYFPVLSSCIPSIDVFEKNVAIPKQQWQSSFEPEVTFNITDTVSSYNIYVVIRHTDAYNYTSPHNQRYNLTLATNEKGWLGSAMDDIYEQRVLIQPQTKFQKPGDYHFTFRQIMREDPLQHVLDIGLRVEKAK